MIRDTIKRSKYLYACKSKEHKKYLASESSEQWEENGANCDLTRYSQHLLALATSATATAPTWASTAVNREPNQMQIDLIHLEVVVS